MKVTEGSYWDLCHVLHTCQETFSQFLLNLEQKLSPSLHCLVHCLNKRLNIRHIPRMFQNVKKSVFTLTAQKSFDLKNFCTAETSVTSILALPPFFRGRENRPLAIAMQQHVKQTQSNINTTIIYYNPQSHINIPIIQLHWRNLFTYLYLFSKKIPRKKWTIWVCFCLNITVSLVPLR